MARQKGILKIEGTVSGMTFYRTLDGHLVKEKSEISAEKIANDPAFARTREMAKSLALQLQVVSSSGIRLEI